MFEVGEYIICGNNGVCRVENIGPMKISGMKKDRIYYTLSPVYSGGSVVYTPVDNQKIVMRSVLSRDEAERLIDDMKDIETFWIQDEKRREELLKESLKTCDCREWVKIIKTLYLRKQSRLANGKKEIAVDKRYLHVAEDSLYGELAIALNMPKSQVEQFVCERIEALEKADFTRNDKMV